MRRFYLVLLLAPLLLALPTSGYAQEGHGQSAIFSMEGKAVASDDIYPYPSRLYIAVGGREECYFFSHDKYAYMLIESSNPEVVRMPDLYSPVRYELSDGRVLHQILVHGYNRGVCTLTFKFSKTKEFSNCVSVQLDAVVMGPEEFEYSNVCIDGVYYNFDSEKLTAEVVKVPEGLEPYKGKIAIPSKLEWYGWTYMVTSVGGRAFASCDITSVQLPISLKEIKENAFTQSKLTYVDILDAVESIGESAFKDCASLESVYLGKGVKTIGLGAFVGCAKLKRFFITDDSEVFSENDGVIYDKNLTKLILVPYGKESVSIPASVRTIGAGSFMGNKLIGNIDFPDTLEKIEEHACSGCTTLSQITIPDNVTSIGDYAFSECSDIWKISLGNKLLTIGENAFCDSRNVSEIHIKSILPPFVSATSFVNYDATLYVPVGRKNSYANANVWSNFKNIEESTFSGVEELTAGEGEDAGDIYNLKGVLIKRNASEADINTLPADMYLIGGKKVMVK